MGANRDDRDILKLQAITSTSSECLNWAEENPLELIFPHEIVAFRKNPAQLCANPAFKDHKSTFSA